MKESVFKNLENIYEVGGSSPNRLTAMEGLRGLAVILVFFVHYHALFAGSLDVNSISFNISKFLEVNGNSGVDLFFVLSGFLVSIYGGSPTLKARYARHRTHERMHDNTCGTSTSRRGLLIRARSWR